MHQSSVTMTTRTTSTTSKSLQTKTEKMGWVDREQDFEEDDFMTDGFANLHAILAGKGTGEIRFLVLVVFLFVCF